MNEAVICKAHTWQGENHDRCTPCETGNPGQLQVAVLKPMHNNLYFFQRSSDGKAEKDPQMAEKQDNGRKEAVWKQLRFLPDCRAKDFLSPCSYGMLGVRASTTPGAM